jgi:5-methyltetrahydrofolate--homocysteine methyltransferase
LAQAIITGNAPQAKLFTEEALAGGIDAGDVITGGLVPGMAVVGERFKNNEYYIPEVLLAARAMKTSLAILKPLLGTSKFEPIGTVVIGTAKGDLHDIGKNLVAMMLEGASFRVVDLGVDVTAEKMVNAVKEYDAGLVAISALLTTTMVNMRDIIEGLKAADLRDKVKVIVGGAPVTQRWADEIGADGYAPDAASGVEVAKALLGVAPAVAAV